MILKDELWRRAVALALTTAIIATSTAPAAAQLADRIPPVIVCVGA